MRAVGAGGVVYRDILIEEYATIIELDGRLGHEEASGVFRDQWRDNSATLTGLATLRYGWLAIAGSPCATAEQVATLLTVRGWRGRIRRCGPGCRIRGARNAA